MDKTEIGTLPTQKQLHWLCEHQTDLVIGILGPHQAPGDFGDIRQVSDTILYAIMHQVTMAVDRIRGPILGSASTDDWWHPTDYSGRNGGAVGYPTRFQAELAALGAPEEVVNDG